MYAQLDRTVGALLDALDRLVGVDQYVVALTADHGVAEIPEQLIADRRDGGRLDSTEITNAIERAGQATLGPGRYVARLVGNHIYFEPGMYGKLTASPASLAAVVNAIQARPGVRRVFQAGELAGATESHDDLVRAAALSYVPGRSGDMVISPKPGWMFGRTGTTHGSANADDQRVPILFYGKGIKPGRYMDAATPADVTPTLAATIGIAMPSAQGNALHSALSDASTAGSSVTPRP
jgi:arylsulfatase A-like enzyme